MTIFFNLGAAEKRKKHKKPADSMIIGHSSRSIVGDENSSPKYSDRLFSTINNRLSEASRQEVSHRTSEKYLWQRVNSQLSFPCQPYSLREALAQAQSSTVGTSAQALRESQRQKLGLCEDNLRASVSLQILEIMQKFFTTAARHGIGTGHGKVDCITSILTSFFSRNQPLAFWKDHGSLLMARENDLKQIAFHLLCPEDSGAEQLPKSSLADEVKSPSLSRECGLPETAQEAISDKSTSVLSLSNENPIHLPPPVPTYYSLAIRIPQTFFLENPDNVNQWRLVTDLRQPRIHGLHLCPKPMIFPSGPDYEVIREPRLLREIHLSWTNLKELALTNWQGFVEYEYTKHGGAVNLSQEDYIRFSLDEYHSNDMLPILDWLARGPGTVYHRDMRLNRWATVSAIRLRIALTNFLGAAPCLEFFRVSSLVGGFRYYLKEIRIIYKGFHSDIATFKKVAYWEVPGRAIDWVTDRSVKANTMVYIPAPESGYYAMQGYP